MYNNQNNQYNQQQQTGYYNDYNNYQNGSPPQQQQYQQQPQQQYQQQPYQQQQFQSEPNQQYNPTGPDARPRRKSKFHPRVPPDLQQLLEEMAKEVRINQPPNIYLFLAEYTDRLLKQGYVLDKNKSTMTLLKPYPKHNEIKAPAKKNGPAAVNSSLSQISHGFFGSPSFVMPPALLELVSTNKIIVEDNTAGGCLSGFNCKKRYDILDASGDRIFYATESFDCCTSCCSCCTSGQSRLWGLHVYDSNGKTILKGSRQGKNCMITCPLLENMPFGGISPDYGRCRCQIKSWHLIDETESPVLFLDAAEFHKKHGDGPEGKKEDDDDSKRNSKDKSGEGNGEKHRFSFHHMMDTFHFEEDGKTMDFPLWTIYEPRQQIGKVSKTIGRQGKEPLFQVEFPIDLDVRLKAVLIYAMFLIDFVYFQFAERKSKDKNKK